MFQGEEVDYTDLMDDDDDAEFDYGDGELPDPTEMTWPTPSGIYYEQARRNCEQAIANATSYQICRNLPSLDIFGSIYRCVDDIRVRNAKQM